MNSRNLRKYWNVVFGLQRDEALGLLVLAWIGKRLLPNYKFTWPQLDWFYSAELAETLDHFEEASGFNAHRRFALQELLRLTEAVPGDTAECGVYKGCGSYIILKHNIRSTCPRTHHLFDSFEGLSAPQGQDGSYWTAGALSVQEDAVRQNLAQFPNIRLYKGWIPDRFGDVAERTFSFVHVDVDLYQPTYDSIVFFYERLNPGAVFVCDDYGFRTCPGATTAIDEFLRDKPEKMVGLAGGGGFFMKGCMTSSQ